MKPVNNFQSTTVHPPQAPEVEQTILASMMMEVESSSQALSLLVPIDFYDQRNRQIFQAFTEIYESGVSCDLVALESHLASKEQLKDVGGIEYLADLTRAAGASDHIGYYCKIVKDKSRARNSIDQFRQVIRRAHEPDQDIHELLIECEKFVYSNLVGESAERTKTIADLVQRSFDEVISIQGAAGGIIGLRSGLPIDQITGGFQKQKMYVVAGRPGMGKTAFMLQVMKQIASDGGRPGVISLEMGGVSLAKRMLLSEAGVDSQRARTGKLNDGEKNRLSTATDRLKKLKIVIDDSTEVTPASLRIKARMMKQVHQIGVLAVDYLQLMTSDDHKQSREQEVSSISRTLKLLSKELDIPVIALAQLSRKPDDRREWNTRPQNSDLRESGAIENDADVVLMLYRPEEYGLEKYKDGSSTENITELIISKHRDGPTGIKKVVFNAEQMNFSALHTPAQPAQSKPGMEWLYD